MELGVKERDMLETYIYANALPKVAIGVAGLTAAAGIGFAGYGVYWWSKKMFGWADEAANEIQQALDKAKSIAVEGVIGKSQYTDPQTQEIYKNPFAGVPLVGGLFGFGMKQGAKTDMQKDHERAKQNLTGDETGLDPSPTGPADYDDPNRTFTLTSVYWNPARSAWIRSPDGKVMSKDPNDPLYS